MLVGSVLGIFATEEGGVPKPSVDSIDVRLNGVYGCLLYTSDAADE